MTFWEWVVRFISTYWPLFLRGVGVTLLLALVGTCVGLVIGIVVGVLRTIPARTGNQKGLTPRFVLIKIMNFFLTAYIELLRGTPMMVQAMLVFFGLKYAFNIDLPPLPSGLLVISLNTGAYMAEVVRGGIESVALGQGEAAKAVGMTHWQSMLNVILPQAIRNIMPATANEFIINIKDSSVLSIIQVSELFFAATTVAGVHARVVEPFFIAAAVYLFLTFTVSRLLRLVEKRMDGPANFKLLASSSTAHLVHAQHSSYQNTNPIKAPRRRPDKPK